MSRLIMILSLCALGVAGCSKKVVHEDLYIRGRQYILWVAPVAVAVVNEKYGRDRAVQVAIDIGLHCGRIQAARRTGDLSRVTGEITDLIGLIGELDDQRLAEFNAWGNVIMASASILIHIPSFELPDEVDWAQWSQSMIDQMGDGHQAVANLKKFEGGL